MKSPSALGWVVRFILLTVLFLVFFAAGGALVEPSLPTGGTSEPGPIPAPFDLLLVGAGQTLVLMLLILRSRWSGWRLMVATAVAYYGCVTVLMQIETAYFLTRLTVGPETLRALFLMGLPVTLGFIPLAVLILGKARRAGTGAAPDGGLSMPVAQWAWKLAACVLVYELLYFSAGYFIAWRTPEVRAFYQGTDPGSFFAQLRNVCTGDPWLMPFQALRALLWVAFALPVIRMTRGSAWQVALVVGVLFSVPQNLSHLLANPLMPSNIVRLTHMVETASSTFVYGLVVTWLLYRAHASPRDLFGSRGVPTTPPPRAALPRA
jgi:hypothetical protein